MGCSPAEGPESDDDDLFYGEQGSSFDSFYGVEDIRSVDDTLPNLADLKETELFANR